MRAASRLAPLGLLLFGCQVVAGIESRSVDPLEEGCRLPAEGLGTLRVANMVPADKHVDFCVRAAGGQYGRPILRGGGTGCPNGFAFKDVSAPFRVPTGKIDIKTIEAGLTCSAPALSEALGVDVGERPLTAVRLGGNAETISLFVDSPPDPGASLRLRVLHAAVGLSTVVVGLAKEKRLPTEIDGRLIPDPIPFGHTPPPSKKLAFGSLDENGYLQVPANDFLLGIATETSPRALLVAPVQRTNSNRTLYAVGRDGDASYPIRGVLCEDVTNDGVRTRCTDTDLATLSIDSWNAGLYGAFAVEEAARRPHVIEAISRRGSDIMCISEVARKADREAIVAAAQQTGQFPYHLLATTDLGTAATEPQDANGTVPPAPTTPSCGGSVDPSKVDAAYKCMVDFCSTKAGDDSGSLNGDANCLSSKCAVDLLRLLGGSREEQRCVDCMLANVVSLKSYAQNKLSCTSDRRAQYAFEGETPVMMLSKLPIEESETYVLPSTLWRRAVLHSKVKLEAGKSLDVYCSELGPLLGDLMPYTGPYGGGDDSLGWENEQLLQSQKLVNYVKRKSGARPAVVLGDFVASVAQDVNGQRVVDDSNPEVIRRLRAAFVEAIAPGYEAKCTRCPKSVNAYNSESTRVWGVRTFLFNMKEGSTTESGLFFTQPVVPLGTTTGMLSDTFGYNVRVLRP